MDRLAKLAAALRRSAGSRPRQPGPPGPKLPSLLLFTDPARTPDPLKAAAGLPPGAGVVFRAFGAPDALETGRALAALARRRKLLFLVGADPVLAAAVGAQGLHLPERMIRRARALRRPGWIITAAAHSIAAAKAAARAGADAAVVSPVFESRSPSAGPAIGPLRFTVIVREAGLPVYALGGVGSQTARRLMGSGAIGLAAIEALAG